MIYRLLADSVLVLHLGFILFAVLGGALALWRRRVAWLHLPAAAWAALVTLFGWTCPLTPLEVRLRLLGGQAGYDGGFIEHYLTSLIYPAGLTRGVQVLLAVAVVAVNVAVYVRLWRVAVPVHERRECGRQDDPACRELPGPAQAGRSSVAAAAAGAGAEGRIAAATGLVHGTPP
jgi:hypothetical protein